MISLHPYEYLTELNNIYTSCNKANAKSYSSVSKLKLAWKPFSLMKIPNVYLYIILYSVLNLLIKNNIIIRNKIRIRINKLWKIVKKKYGKNINKY